MCKECAEGGLVSREVRWLLALGLRQMECVVLWDCEVLLVRQGILSSEPSVPNK